MGKAPEELGLRQRVMENSEVEREPVLEDFVLLEIYLAAGSPCFTVNNKMYCYSFGLRIDSPTISAARLKADLYILKKKQLFFSLSFIEVIVLPICSQTPSPGSVINGLGTKGAVNTVSAESASASSSNSASKAGQALVLISLLIRVLFNDVCSMEAPRSVLDGLGSVTARVSW